GETRHCVSVPETPIVIAERSNSDHVPGAPRHTNSEVVARTAESVAGRDSLSDCENSCRPVRITASKVQITVRAGLAPAHIDDTRHVPNSPFERVDILLVIVQVLGVRAQNDLRIDCVSFIEWVGGRQDTRDYRRMVTDVLTQRTEWVDGRAEVYN